MPTFFSIMIGATTGALTAYLGHPWWVGILVTTLIISVVLAIRYKP